MRSLTEGLESLLQETLQKQAKRCVTHSMSDKCNACISYENGARDFILEIFPRIQELEEEINRQQSKMNTIMRLR